VFRSSIITYDGLPVSKGGAHRLRTPNPKLALQQARDFLTACTDTSIPKVALWKLFGATALMMSFRFR
jgi:hypothetical protein